MKVEILVYLDIDCREDELFNIIGEMDYNFSHVVMVNDIEKDLIIDSEIINYDIVNY